MRWDEQVMKKRWCSVCGSRRQSVKSKLSLCLAPLSACRAPSSFQLCIKMGRQGTADNRAIITVTITFRGLICCPKGGSQKRPWTAGILTSAKGTKMSSQGLRCFTTRDLGRPETPMNALSSSHQGLALTERRPLATSGQCSCGGTDPNPSRRVTAGANAGLRG